MAGIPESAGDQVHSSTSSVKRDPFFLVFPDLTQEVFNYLLTREDVTIFEKICKSSFWFSVHVWEVRSRDEQKVVSISSVTLFFSRLVAPRAPSLLAPTCLLTFRSTFPGSHMFRRGTRLWEGQ